jgi:hypothetical protein
MPKCDSCTMKRFFYGLLIALALSFPGILTTGCNKTLNPSGVYSQPGGGGLVAYNTDLSITTAKDVLDVFVKWERDNRPALVATPEVKQYADSIRQQAPGWFKSAVALSDAYKASPTTENLNAFNAAMAVIQSAVGQAQQYLAKAVTTKK